MPPTTRLTLREGSLARWCSTSCLNHLSRTAVIFSLVPYVAACIQFSNIIAPDKLPSSRRNCKIRRNCSISHIQTYKKLKITTMRLLGWAIEHLRSTIFLLSKIKIRPQSISKLDSKSSLLSKTNSVKRAVKMLKRRLRLPFEAVNLVVWPWRRVGRERKRWCRKWR